MLSFLGETPTQALGKAQEECGEDAIVISTKKIASKTKDTNDIYEIMVMLEDDNTNVVKETISPPITKELTNQDVSFYDFKSEILAIQDEIKKVQKLLWEPKSKLYDIDVPSEFVDIYNLFEQNEINEEMRYTIIKQAIAQLPISMKNTPEKINNFFRLVLKRIISLKYEVSLRIHQRKVMMFIGPTGVGKTTTLAKLAARYAYKMGVDYKVGIITLDSFRIGAVEQLKSYTNIMRLSLEVVKKPDDLVEAMLRLKDCNYILIDTMGSSQYDIEKIEQIDIYQNRLKDIDIEKILVLPANIKQTDLTQVYENYSMLDIDNIIFTKLDETKSFGNIISFIYKIKKSISYFSIGQNVPDDLIEVDDEYLINCFMNLIIPKR